MSHQDDAGPGLLDTLALRAAVDGDAGEILTLQRAAYLAEAQAYRDPFIPPLTETLAEVREQIRTVTVLVATTGHRLVAAVRLEVSGSTGRIGRLAVVPDLQGHGVGARMLQAAEAAAPAGVTRFELFTGAASTRNLALYTHRGYVEFDRQRLNESVELVHLRRPR